MLKKSSWIKFLSADLSCLCQLHPNPKLMLNYLLTSLANPFLPCLIPPSKFVQERSPFSRQSFRQGLIIVEKTYSPALVTMILHYSHRGCHMTSPIIAIFTFNRHDHYILVEPLAVQPCQCQNCWRVSHSAKYCRSTARCPVYAGVALPTSASLSWKFSN